MANFAKPMLAGLLLFAVVSGAVFFCESQRCPLRKGMTLAEADAVMEEQGIELLRWGRAGLPTFVWSRGFRATFREDRIETIVDNRPPLISRCRQFLFKTDQPVYPPVAYSPRAY